MQVYLLNIPKSILDKTTKKYFSRFYDPLEGNIFINNQDIKLVTLESLRKSIGIVPQETVLFHDTIYHNISYGDLLADEEQVFDAARMADIHDSILSMPKQYKTEASINKLINPLFIVLMLLSLIS